MVQKKESKKKKAKKVKTKRLSNQRLPENMTLQNWQIGLRKQYAESQNYKLGNFGTEKIYSDFIVLNPETKTNYRVAIRSLEPGNNYCSCLDFKTNTLGTCKHIEWVLYKFRNTWGMKKHFKIKPVPKPYTSVYVHYGTERIIKIRIGKDNKTTFEKLAKKYFDDDGILKATAYLKFERFLEKARAIDQGFRCYEDVMDLLIEKRALEKRKKILAPYQKSPAKMLKDIIKTTLYPYQREGVLFSAIAGRCLIADEMGLGKTIQALAATELLKKEMKISKVVIVCPTSLKYQWKSEIQKFTESSVEVIDGNPLKRIKTYNSSDSFYLILTYNVLGRDVNVINDLNVDLVILDEAQRIKNWNTKISRAVKALTVPHCIVLTGTPLENKLEELYSITQFVDQFALGPVFAFLHNHQVKNENGQVVGYRNLNQIQKKLSHLMVRRKKADVIKQMPRRMDKTLFVPMTEMQAQLHIEYGDQVARLVARWRRFGFLREEDRKKLMRYLQLMRMSCNSTWIIDQETRHDTKVDELMYILEERFANPNAKVVIFSQWARMTHLIASELEARNIPFVHLHGGVPGNKRGDLLDTFREDPKCLIFLSTDAGGVGLNLQSASMVINLDLPWNPAVLEQRIARVYRLGQANQVQVINLVSTGTIEHRMIDVLKFKAGLADGVLDAGEDNIFMSESRFKKFMNSVEEVASTTGKRDSEPQPFIAEGENEETNAQQKEPQPDIQEIWKNEVPQPDSLIEKSNGSNQGQPTKEPATSNDLIQTGMQFFSQLTKTLSNPKATQDLVNNLVETDKDTGQSYLKIPVEGKEIVQNAMQLLGALMGNRK